jgi:hypothetical protein
MKYGLEWFYLVESIFHNTERDAVAKSPVFHPEQGALK